MTTEVTITVDARNAQADALARKLDDGSVKIYDGTPPANVDAALSGNTLLATNELSATSAPAASAGAITFNTISDDVSIDADGTASFYRSYETDGVTAVTQGSVGTTGSGESMIIATGLVLVEAEVFEIASWVHTV